MEIIQVMPSPEYAEAHPTQQTKTKRSRSRSAGEGPFPVNKRVRIPPICLPAFFHLKEELGLCSDADTVQWLIHQARPQLVPAIQPPNSPRNRPNRNVVTHSVSKTLCMQCLHTDKLVPYVPVASAGAPAARKPVRATVVQASTVFFDTPATMDKAERLITGAAAFGSQLVVFPEAFLGGYPQCMMRFGNGGDDDQQKYYASAIEVPGPEVDRLAQIAGKYKVHLIMGVVERAGLYLFSTLVFFDSKGKYIGKQRKLMPMPSECAVWSCGEKSPLPVYETSIGKIGGLICWDNKSPLLRSELYAKGIEIHCAPCAESREVWKASMIHIAVEGCCFVLSANQFCRRGDYPLPTADSAGNVSAEEITCSGGSVIISPLGNILAGPNYQGECLISADLDIVEVSQARMEFGAVNNTFKPNHDDWVASEAGPVLFATDVKEVPDRLA